jgi:ankyrin repeat protein
LDATFGDGNTALHLAVFLGAGDLVTALVERGASLTVKNGKGFTPVDVSDRPEIIALLQ